MAFILHDHSCGNCMGDSRKTWRRKFSPAERDALMATGLAEETIDGQPVIAAVLLPRRAFVHMSGMMSPGWVDYELPSFRCPWSPAARPHVISHGPAWRSDSGETCELRLDENGCFHRASHCTANPIAPSDYFVRPFTMQELQRRRIKSNQCTR